MTSDNEKMPLRKKLSVAFGKGKKKAASEGSSRDSMQIIPEDEAADSVHMDAEAQLMSLQAEVSGFDALKAEHQQHTDELNVMLESLQLHCDKLEQIHQDDRAEITRCRSELQQSQAEIQQLELSIAKQKGQLQQILPRLQSVDAERAEAEDLRSDIKKYQAWAVRVNEREIADKRRIQSLEEQLQYVVASADKPITDILQDRVDLSEKLVSSQSQLAQSRAAFDAERKKLTDKLSQLQAACGAAVAQASNARGEVTKLEALLLSEESSAEISAKKLAVLGAETTRISDDLKAATSTISALNSIVGGGFTPRMLLTLKLVANARPASTDSLHPDRFSLSRLFERLLEDGLDTQLSGTDLSQLADELNTTESGRELCQELAMQACWICGVFKFAAKRRRTGSRQINEFPNRTEKTACCSRAVCSHCYLNGLVRTLHDGWWQNLAYTSTPWIKCPVPECESALELRQGADGLQRILQSVNDREITSHLKMYERAEAFRSVLAKIAPKPTEEALRKASEVHRVLIARESMYPYLDDSLSVSIPDETGRIPAFNPGTVRTYRVDHEDGGLEIPFLMKLFRRSPVARECVVCAETMYDVNYSSTEQWVETCDGISGDWMWKVLVFPAMLGLECDHEIDTCRDCLSMHLDTQLAQFGRSHCDELVCPSEMCARKLSYDEVRTYANKETFEKYDHYRFLNLISTEPNFRWCLNEACTSGHIYDMGDGEPNERSISCEECGFQMCFHHQVPWHEGLTCEQFDSSRSEAFQQSENFISTNTKQCPECSVNIEKGEWCFHMTCRQCKFEFCWVCLADWKRIHPDDGDEYDREGHEEGCFFRTSGLEPTELSGQEVEAAYREFRARHPDD